jgi:hypothetical protein
MYRRPALEAAVVRGPLLAVASVVRVKLLEPVTARVKVRASAKGKANEMGSVKLPAIVGAKESAESRRQAMAGRPRLGLGLRQ